MNRLNSKCDICFMNIGNNKFETPADLCKHVKEEHGDFEVQFSCEEHNMIFDEFHELLCHVLNDPHLINAKSIMLKSYTAVIPREQEKITIFYDSFQMNYR
jgi:hypothetical protein